MEYITVDVYKDVLKNFNISLKRRLKKNLLLQNFSNNEYLKSIA